MLFPGQPDIVTTALLQEGILNSERGLPWQCGCANGSSGGGGGGKRSGAGHVPVRESGSSRSSMPDPSLPVGALGEVVMWRGTLRSPCYSTN